MAYGETMTKFAVIGWQRVNPSVGNVCEYMYSTHAYKCHKCHIELCSHSALCVYHVVTCHPPFLSETSGEVTSMVTRNN